MLMAVQDSYLLTVQPDDIMISPREIDENFGTMVCFHPRYALGDSHNYIDKDDFLREMYLDTVGHDEKGMDRYEQMVNAVSSRYIRGSKTEERAVDDAMLKVISEKYIMMPLYLLDHSDLVMRTESFHDSKNSEPVGWIYVSKENALKEFGGEKMTDAIRRRTETLMRNEVTVYDSYLRGECYGFKLYKDGELWDSCWGVIGSLEEVRKAMFDQLPEGCRGMLDRLTEQNHPASIIRTLLRHAKIQADQASRSSQLVPRRQVAMDAR